MQSSDLHEALDALDTSPSRCAARFLICASRVYIASRVAGAPEHPWESIPANREPEWRVLDALAQIWDSLLSITSTPIILHDPGCPCLSLHEQAVLTALRSLQGAAQIGYERTLAAILPPAGPRLMRAEMQTLADALTTLECREPRPTKKERHLVLVCAHGRLLHSEAPERG